MSLILLLMLSFSSSFSSGSTQQRSAQEELHNLKKDLLRGVWYFSERRDIYNFLITKIPSFKEDLHQAIERGNVREVCNILEAAGVAKDKTIAILVDDLKEPKKIRGLKEMDERMSRYIRDARNFYLHKTTGNAIYLKKLIDSVCPHAFGIAKWGIYVNDDSIIELFAFVDDYKTAIEFLVRMEPYADGAAGEAVSTSLDWLLYIHGEKAKEFYKEQLMTEAERHDGIASRYRRLLDMIK